MIEIESWPLAGAPTASTLATLVVPCSRLAHDLLTEPQVASQLTNPEWWVGYDPAHRVPEAWKTVGLKVEGQTRFGAGIDLGLPPLALVVRVAEIVQDHLTGYEYIQWPACPGHRHIMLPAVDQAEAWWVCNNPNGPRVRIGNLGA